MGMFANRTYQPGLEAELRRALVAALVTRGETVGGELSDYILAGEIVSMNSDASAFSAQDTAMYYRLVLTVQASLTDRRSGTVIWKGEEVIRQGYPASSDLAIQRNAHDAAVSAACAHGAQILIARLNQIF